MTAHMTAILSCGSARALSDGKSCGKLRPIGSLGKHANGTLGGNSAPTTFKRNIEVSSCGRIAKSISYGDNESTGQYIDTFRAQLC
jgi:hypothetical protein